MRISPRLRRIAAHLRRGEPLWDIGCDHGILGTFALSKDYVSEAYFVDPAADGLPSNPHRLPVTIDRNRVHLFPVAAEDMSPHPVSGTVVCAGMGAATILSIGSSFILPNALYPLRWIVETLTEHDRLCAYFEQQGFVNLKSEKISERGRTRDIDIFERTYLAG